MPADAGLLRQQRYPVPGAGRWSKAEIAERLLGEGDRISGQVLNEVANACRRKVRYDWSATATLLDDMQALLVVNDVTLAMHRRGTYLADRYRLSVYDGMIEAAALATGCEVLYSEDMHTGPELPRPGTMSTVRWTAWAGRRWTARGLGHAPNRNLFLLSR